MFATHKRHILGRNRMFWRVLRQNPSRALGCSELQEPPKKTKKLIRFGCAKSRMRGSETPGRIVTNFCTDVGVHDVITCRFVLRSLTGFGRGGGQILAFSIDLFRRPYNTLALPCECVICILYHFLSYLALNNIMILKSGLEITQGHSNWYSSKACVRFLFAFYSNYGSILHHFRDMARYWSNIVIFFIRPCIRRPR